MGAGKQVMTIAIACSQECPATMPDTCMDCPLVNKANTKVIEVLADKRHNDEMPPVLPEQNVITAKEDADGKVHPVS